MSAPDPTFPTAVSSDTVAAMERIERDVSAALFEHASADVTARLGLHHRRVGDGVLTLSKVLDHIMICRLQGYGIEHPVTATVIDGAIATFRDAGIKNWVVQAVPSAESLASLLAERGFTRHPRTWAKFLYGRDAPPVARTDLAVREVGAAQADAMGAIACTAFEMPPFAVPWLAAIVGKPGFRTYIAFDGETPVATGTAFIDGKSAWLGFGATLASHRKRGAQGAILAARVKAALDAGATLISTETGIPHWDEAGPSFRNIQRAGFRIAYERPNWRLAPATP